MVATPSHHSQNENSFEEWTQFYAADEQDLTYYDAEDFVDSDSEHQQAFKRSGLEIRILIDSIPCYKFLDATDKEEARTSSQKKDKSTFDAANSTL